MTSEYSPANEYVSVGGTGVAYDAAGNLQTDASGHQYLYDEQNRLTEVRNSGGTSLARYVYDALGRRIQAQDPGTGQIINFYYDGQNVIEERDGAAAGEPRLRCHFNGAQYIDERVATYTDSTAAVTYYLLKDNFSVAGTGDAAGNVQRLDYDAAGSFGGAGGADFDHDGDVDAADAAHLKACAANGPDVAPPADDGLPPARPCVDADLDRDQDIDGVDLARFQACMSGENETPPAGCAGGAPPPAPSHSTAVRWTSSPTATPSSTSAPVPTTSPPAAGSNATRWNTPMDQISMRHSARMQLPPLTPSAWISGKGPVNRVRQN